MQILYRWQTLKAQRMLNSHPLMEEYPAPLLQWHHLHERPLNVQFPPVVPLQLHRPCNLPMAIRNIREHPLQHSNRLPPNRNPVLP